MLSGAVYSKKKKLMRVSEKISKTFSPTIPILLERLP